MAVSDPIELQEPCQNPLGRTSDEYGPQVAALEMQPLTLSNTLMAPERPGTSGTKRVEEPAGNPPMLASPEEPTSLPSEEPPRPIPSSLTRRLYTSHFLSTWNSRLFEFGAVLFLADIFPGTLLPMSVYALARSGAAILLSPAVGAWIDGGDRLAVVRASIVGQRLAVAASCAVFWVMERKRDSMGMAASDELLAVLTVLGCVEKLCSVMNLVSVERDWVVVIAGGNDDTLRVLNARMRRIDLLCKLLGPLAISTIAIASTLVAVWSTLGMSAASVFAEYFCIASVYKMVPSLRRSESRPEEIPLTLGETQVPTRPPRKSAIAVLRSTITHKILPISDLRFYVRHRAFLPSFSLSLLYLTVLSFSGQMITFLLSAGYTPLHVGIARTASTTCELSATWLAPRLMRRVGAVRGGIWSLGWQMAWLAAGASWFFSGGFGGLRGLGGGGGGGSSSSISADAAVVGVVPATGLAVAVALSRVGLWGFDLCAQAVVQDEVEEARRGRFSAAEAAMQNLFELAAYASTVAFPRPDQFRWPVAVSIAAVYAAGGLYASFVRTRRGHLFHAPPCICPKLEGGNV